MTDIGLIKSRLRVSTETTMLSFLKFRYISNVFGTLITLSLYRDNEKKTINKKYFTYLRVTQ